MDYHRGFYTPFYNFSPAHPRVIRDTFIFLTIPFFPRALRPWVGIFYPQACFTLRSFTDILTCVYQGFPGSRQFFLEVCRASYWSSKHRRGPSICLIHSNPQPSYSERFSFKLYYILSINCLWWKLNLSAPYSFRTLLACSKSYVKTIKKRFEQDYSCTAYNRFNEHQNYSEYHIVFCLKHHDQCFWGLGIFSVQNRSTISGFVPLYRRLTLYHIPGFLSIRYYQFEYRKKKTLTWQWRNSKGKTRLKENGRQMKRQVQVYENLKLGDYYLLINFK